MEWVQFIIFFIGVFGLFIWNRSEARTDARHMDMKLEANRNLMFEIHKETQASIKSVQEESKASLKGIHDMMLAFNEKNNSMMTDFHGKLCALEEKTKKSKS